MNGSIIIFWGLVSLGSSHVVIKSHDNCKDVQPAVYCASKIRAKQCRKTEFCNIYLNRHVCESGPETYCKTANTAKYCGKIANCLTWPDDSVTATLVTPEPDNAILKSIQQFIHNIERNYPQYV